MTSGLSSEATSGPSFVSGNLDVFGLLRGVIRLHHTQLKSEIDWILVTDRAGVEVLRVTAAESLPSQLSLLSSNGNSNSMSDEDAAQSEEILSGDLQFGCGSEQESGQIRSGFSSRPSPRGLRLNTSRIGAKPRSLHSSETGNRSRRTVRTREASEAFVGRESGCSGTGGEAKVVHIVTTHFHFILIHIQFVNFSIIISHL